MVGAGSHRADTNAPQIAKSLGGGGVLGYLLPDGIHGSCKLNKHISRGI